MIDEKLLTTTRTQTAPLRGTLPLNATPAEAVATSTALSATSTPLGDQMLALDAKARLEAFATQQADANLRIAIHNLTMSMYISPMDRKMLNELLSKLDQGLDVREELKDALNYVRDKVQHAEAMAERKLAEQQRQARINQEIYDSNWRIFYESLERYLANLQAMEELEKFVSDRRLNEARSESKFVDRLLTAAAALLPGQSLSLLTAKLSQKA